MRQAQDGHTWSEGWQLGKPDLVITLPQPYTLPAEGTDAFHIFVLPIPVETARFVRGLEFRPGNPRVVHHANIRIDTTPASRAFDAADPGPGYDGLIARSATYPDGHFLGWTPGQVAPLLPNDLAWRLEKNTDLVVELHMQPSGKPEQVAPSIGLYFGDTAPARTPAMLRLGRQDIDIPAGDGHYTVTDSYTLPVDVEVEAVQPHAHYRARDVRGEATLPDGSKKPLIDIADWDFRWQHVYRFVTPMRLPKGTRVSMRYTYDNSTANARNPQRPPARARWGQLSAEEMGDLWLQVLPRDGRDLDLLSRDFRPKVAAEDVKGYEAEIEKHPGDAALHDDVALLYLELGKGDRAIAHFTTSRDLKPQSAVSHYNLGTALTVARRLDEAAGEYREALRIDPATPTPTTTSATSCSRSGSSTRPFANSRKWSACSRTPRPRARTSRPRTAPPDASRRAKPFYTEVVQAFGLLAPGPEAALLRPTASRHEPGPSSAIARLRRACASAGFIFNRTAERRTASSSRPSAESDIARLSSRRYPSAVRRGRW